MDFRKTILCIAVVLSSLVTQTFGASRCSIQGDDVCKYTIVCEYLAGEAFQRDCDYPYITFVMTKSSVDTLTAGFFGSTNFDRKVRVIKANGNLWTNIEAYTFRYYSGTVELDISNNKIDTIKNDSFKNLINMQILNISGNAIQSLNSRSLSIAEDREPKLELLDLSNNLLTELAGEVFNNLSNLKKLYLQNNKLATIAEDCLANLKNLNILDLENNQIDALNMTLINLKSLALLQMSRNRLVNISGFEINRLISVEVVNFSYNAIELIDSNCFNQAAKLKFVDLSNNRIKSPIDSQMFLHNEILIYLDLNKNNITQIQDNAFKFTRLQFLNIDKNNITGDITENMFIGLRNVTFLILSNQSITAVRKNAFSEAVNLVRLDLSQNNIKLIENSSFSRADSLHILDVSHNKLTDVNFLANSLPGLTELYLQHNALDKIPKNAFSFQNLLEKLDISGNAIKIIEQSSLPLNNLQYLFVKDNPLTGVLNNDTFSSANFLRYLDLSNFKISKIDKMAFVNMPVANRFNISYNEIEYIDPNNFMGMDNLISLDVSHNKLSSFFLSNSSLTKLKALYLNNNNLSNISPTLTNMTELAFLDLSYNNINDLSSVKFSQMKNLKILHLCHNKIKNFNNAETNSLKNLVTLGLSANDITEINLSFYTELMDVDISSNKLFSFNSTFFENLNSLQSLNIGNNNITKIVPGTFINIKMLKLLNMSHNHLVNLRYGTFRGLNKTEALDLSHNEITNIDVDVFHECVELKKLIIDFNFISTLNIERLVQTLPNLTSLSLGGNPLACREIVRNIQSFNKNMLRQVEVTSIDKIYHEDNVHGIKCGGTNDTASEEKGTDEHTTSIALIVWCSILTIILIAATVAVYFYRRNQSVSFIESRLQLRSSMSEISASEFQRDLLS